MQNPIPPTLPDRSVLSDAERRLISAAVDAGVQRYLASCRERVPAFVARHFSFKGALRINRKALGLDLVRAPANLLWAAPYLGVRVSGLVLRKAGVSSLGARLERLPSGFSTQVQREVEWLVHTELLGLPRVQGDRAHEEDALLGAILADEALAELLTGYLERIGELAQRPQFERHLQAQLAGYGGTRTAAADLACGVLSLSAGAALFKQLTPGALSTGGALAAAIAQQTAISKFMFGSTLGAMYYGVFPVSASIGLIALSSGGVLAAMGVVSAFSGVLTDPVQARLGIHQRRLHRLIDAMEAALGGEGEAEFRPKDHYVARLFDLFDLLKTSASML